jgi:ribosomal protein L36
MPRNIISSQRRHKFADKVFFLYSFVMRSCAVCRRAGAVYLISDESDSYKQCFRYNRFCDLTFPAHEWERLRKAKERLSAQISEKRRIALKADTAVIRL